MHNVRHLLPLLGRLFAAIVVLVRYMWCIAAVQVMYARLCLLGCCTHEHNYTVNSTLPLLGLSSMFCNATYLGFINVDMLWPVATVGIRGEDRLHEA